MKMTDGNIQRSVHRYGTGPRRTRLGNSAAMTHQHGAVYRKLDQCELVACADLVYVHAEAFATEFAIDENHIYEDYHEMLRSIEPDFVSICTPVTTHAPIVIDCIESGHVSAIHCEKPMADTWGDAQRIAAAAEEHSVQLE